MTVFTRLANRPSVRIFAVRTAMTSTARILLIGALYGAALCCPAQAPEERHGPKLGVSMASIGSGGFIGWNGLPKFGPVVGWGIEAPLSKQAGLLIEPMVMHKGSITVNNVSRVRRDISLYYLEVPLMLKLSLRPDTGGTYLSGGLMYGYLVRGRVRDFLDGNEIDNYQYDPVQSRSQLSIGLGLGRETRNWLFEVRGQNSINLFSRLRTTNNIVFSLQITWRLPLRPPKKSEEEEDAEDSESEEG